MGFGFGGFGFGEFGFGEFGFGQFGFGEFGFEEFRLGALGLGQRGNGKRWKWSLMGYRVKAQPVDIPQEFRFKFPTVPTIDTAQPLIQLNNVSFRYDADGPWSFQNLSLGIHQNSRLVLLGPNGSGKSTLMNVIAGNLPPSSGTILHNPSVRIAYFTQHHMESLNLSLSPVDHLIETFSFHPEDMIIRKQLGKFGISV